MNARPPARVTVIIATFNSARDIAACLGALSDAPPLVTHTVVVVDNASQDATATLVAEHFPYVRLLQSPRNVGYAAANNLGIVASESEILILLNPDTAVRPGAIDRLVQELDQHPEATACGPRLIDTHGRAELSFGAMIGPLNECRQKLLVLGHRRGWPLVTPYVDHLTRTPTTPDWVSGACLCVRRVDAEAVGLLDERYFLYAEDVDFCAALRARGRTVRFVPDAEVVHTRGRSRASVASPAERAYRMSQLAFYEKHHPRWLPLLRAYLRLRGRLPR